MQRLQRPTTPVTPMLRHLSHAHAAQRLIELSKKNLWGKLYQAGRVADSKQLPGQEAA